MEPRKLIHHDVTGKLLYECHILIHRFSFRLLNELRGWVRGHEEEQKRQQHHQEKKVKNKHVKRFGSGHNRNYVHGDRLKHTATHVHSMEQNTYV